MSDKMPVRNGQIEAEVELNLELDKPATQPDQIFPMTTDVSINYDVDKPSSR